MSLFEKIKSAFAGKAKPEHLRHGELGERAAKRHLQKLGLKFLTANFRSDRGEIDLVFRDGDCLAFVEVKARSSEDWTRPAAAVDAERQRRARPRRPPWREQKAGGDAWDPRTVKSEKTTALKQMPPFSQIRDLSRRKDGGHTGVMRRAAQKAA